MNRDSEEKLRENNRAKSFAQQPTQTQPTGAGNDGTSRDGCFSGLRAELAWNPSLACNHQFRDLRMSRDQPACQAVESSALPRPRDGSCSPDSWTRPCHRSAPAERRAHRVARVRTRRRERAMYHGGTDFAGSGSDLARAGRERWETEGARRISPRRRVASCAGRTDSHGSSAAARSCCSASRSR